MNETRIIEKERETLEAQPLGRELFLQWQQSIDVSPKTKETYFRNIRPFWEYINAQGITNPTRRDDLAYRDALTAAGKKPATVSAYLRALHSFFTFTNDCGVYPDIVKGVKAPRPAPGHKKDPLTAAQAAGVLKNIDRDTLQGKRDFAIVALMATAGLRSVEVMRANIGDIQTTSDGRNSYNALFVQGKGRNDREEFVKLSGPVLEAIQDYLAARPGGSVAEAPLFASLSPNSTGQRLTTRSISRICKTAFLRTGINSPRITCHSLRHTAATLNLLNGGTPEETQQLLRHRNPATTQIYSHALQRGENNSEERITAAIFSAEE